MIIERKQYGCITLLFFQVDLALYVAVLFLGPQDQGKIKPVVLSVQKIVDRYLDIDVLTKINDVSSHIYTSLIKSGYKDTANNSISAISNDERILAENSIIEIIISAIESEKRVSFYLASGLRLSSIKILFDAISIIKNTSILSTTFASSYFSLETIGISPRAPTYIV